MKEMQLSRRLPQPGVHFAQEVCGVYGRGFDAFRRKPLPNTKSNARSWLLLLS
jgi:hypothetical protein